MIGKKEQIAKQPAHNCGNASCYDGNVPFGEIYCSSCNAHFEMMDEMYEKNCNNSPVYWKMQQW